MCTVHDFIQCVNKLKVHYENEMQMLNVQIGLDSLWKHRTKIYFLNFHDVHTSQNSQKVSEKQKQTN